MVCLYGDSILDNGPYVPPGLAVINLMREAFGNEVALVARDGAVVRDVFGQIDRHPPVPSDVVVLSVGGNDLLQFPSLYDGQPLTDAHPVMQAIHGMHNDYRRLVGRLRDTGCRLVVCNVYTPAELQDYFAGVMPMALVHELIAYHNRVVAEVVAQHNAEVLDIAALFTDAEDFSHIIEPSVAGGTKLVNALKEIL
jgi:lysophospholipase L1-like esterase